MQQPGQETGSEQPLRHHLGRRRRAGRPRPAARAAAPVTAAPQQDPGQLDLPVDQLAVLAAYELIPRPAARAAPLLRFQVDDAFLGLQVRITAPAVPRRARTLPPPARTIRPSARTVLAAAARGRSALLAGAAEQQPAQRRDRLLQPATSADSPATRAFSSEFSCRSRPAAASARSARARQQARSAPPSITCAGDMLPSAHHHSPAVTHQTRRVADSPAPAWPMRHSTPTPARPPRQHGFTDYLLIILSIMQPSVRPWALIFLLALALTTAFRRTTCLAIFKWRLLTRMRSSRLCTT